MQQNTEYQEATVLASHSKPTYAGTVPAAALVSNRPRDLGRVTVRFECHGQRVQAFDHPSAFSAERLVAGVERVVEKAAANDMATVQMTLVAQNATPEGDDLTYVGGPRYAMDLLDSPTAVRAFSTALGVLEAHPARRDDAFGIESRSAGERPTHATAA